MNGEELTRWTIWTSLLGYALCVALLLGRRAIDLRRRAWARLAWTVGCLFLWLHVACAFHAYHHWSHAEAYEHAARETGAVTGWFWGGGIYFNYLTIALWTADATWWWFAAQSYATRPRFLSVGVHAWLAFILFNATVVFESGPLRWIGVACTAVSGILAVRRMRRGWRIEDGG